MSSPSFATRTLTACSLTLALVAISANGETIAFQDDFQDGNLSNPQWRNSNTSSGTNTGDWSVVTDPADNANRVLRSDPDARTHSINASAIIDQAGPVRVTWRFNPSQAGDQNSNHSLTLLDSDLNSQSNGYRAFILSNGNAIAIQRFDSFSGQETLVTSNDVVINDLAIDGNGWNTVEFVWGAQGQLSLSVNGSTPLTTTDNTYKPMLQRVLLTNFLNNNAGGGVTDRVMLYDDFKAVVIPEPGSFGLLGLGGLLALSRGHRSR